MIYPTVRKFNKLGFATGKLSSHLARNAHFYGAAGGALAGAGIGYLTSDEKDKKKRLRNAAIGGLLGAGAGYVGGSQIAKKQLAGELKHSGAVNLIGEDKKLTGKVEMKNTAFNRDALKKLGVKKNMYDLSNGADGILFDSDKLIGVNREALNEYYNKRRKWLI